RRSSDDPRFDGRPAVVDVAFGARERGIGDVLEVLELDAAEDVGADEDVEAGAVGGVGAALERFADDRDAAEEGDLRDRSRFALEFDAADDDGVAVGNRRETLDLVLLARRGESRGRRVADERTERN